MLDQMLTVNGDDIEVFGKVARTVQFGNQLHCHAFLVMALPRLLLGWDFMRTHHTHIKAATETVPIWCRCPLLYKMLDQSSSCPAGP